MSALLATLLMITSALPCTNGDDTARPARVRTGDPQIRTLLTEGAARSPAFDVLLNRFERTGWLVFIARGRCPIRYAVGCLAHTIGRYEGEPYLRIRFDHWQLRRREEQISTIAHELQHALEVAEAQDVVDSESLVRFFRRTGHVSMKTEWGTGYETKAAKRVGKQVLAELWGSPRITSERRSAHLSAGTTPCDETRERDRTDQAESGRR